MIAATAFIAFCICIPRAVALDIIPTFDSSITGDASAAAIQTTINAACFEYKYRIADAGTVRILMKKMNSGLGQSQGGGTWEVYPTYSQVRTALAAHQTTTLDAQAVSSLPVTTNNPVNNYTHMRVKLALARVLGLTTNAPAVDNELSFNTSECKLSPSGAWPFFGYSLYAVVCHEINEAIGFGSALDNVNNGDPVPSQWVSIPDLFRYDQNGSRSWTTDAGAQAWLYVPSHGQIRRFNQTQGGDFNDWAGDGAARVNDAYGTALADPLLNEEITELDLIGYKMLPKPVWLDLNEICCQNDGGYFWAYNSESSAGNNVESGGAIMIKGSPTLHHSRLDASTYGKPVKLTSFNGTTRIVP